MKSQDIAVADRAPNVRRVIEGGERNRDLRPILQARCIDGVIELVQVGKGRESCAGVKIFQPEIQFFDQLADNFPGQVWVVLQPHGIAHAPLANSLLDGAEEILVAPARDQKIGVARHAKGMAGENLEAVVKPRQVLMQDIFQHHKGVLSFPRGQRDEARRHLGRNMDHRKIGVRQARSDRRAQGKYQAQGTIRQVGKGMPRIDGEGRYDRVERAVEKFFEKTFLLPIHFFRPDQVNAFAGQSRQNRVEKAQVLLLGQFVNALRYRGQRFAGR